MVQLEQQNAVDWVLRKTELLRWLPAPPDSARNSFDVMLESLVLFVAGAVGMLLPLLAMTSGSVSAVRFQSDEPSRADHRNRNEERY
jgi:hypothetical protein